jgi:hypothetical protein
MGWIGRGIIGDRVGGWSGVVTEIKNKTHFIVLRYEIFKNYNL